MLNSDHTNSGGRSVLVPPAQWMRSPDNPKRTPPWTFVVVITVLAGALRLLWLTKQSLWVDELLTWQAIRPGGSLGFVEQFLDTIQGPLYLAVVWPLLNWQDSALMMRLPAAMAGIATIPVFAVLASRLVNRQAAFLSTLLLALNPFHIWYSQEGRGYAFLMLWAVVTGLFYVNMVRRKPTWRQALGFGLAGGLMVLSNMSGVFLLLAMALTLLTCHRPLGMGRASWWWCLAFGLAGLIAAPWLLKASGIWAVERVVPGAATGLALRGETTFSPLAVPYAIFTFFFGYSFGPSLRQLHQPDRLAVLMTYAPLLVAGFGVVALAVAPVVTRFNRHRAALLIWIVVPVVLLAVLASRNVKPWNPRYVAVVLPWIILLTGIGLSRWRQAWGLSVSVALMGLTMWSLLGYFQNDDYAKADLRAAATINQEMVLTSQPILVPGVTGVYNYYDRGRHRLIDSYGRAPLSDAAAADSYLREVLAGLDRVQVVLAREWYFDPHGLLVPALSRLGRLQLQNELPGVLNYSWQRFEWGSPSGEF